MHTKCVKPFCSAENIYKSLPLDYSQNILQKISQTCFDYVSARVETEWLTCKNLQVSCKRGLTCKNLQVEWLTCKNL